MSHSVPYLMSGTLLLGGIGTYRIESVLGIGTFSIVYKATVVDVDPEVNTSVAVKELFVNGINTRDNDMVLTSDDYIEEMQSHVRHFQTEADNLSSLDIEGVVGFIEDIEANGTHYHVMELADGISLEKYVNSNKVTEELAVNIFRKLSKLVRDLHEKAHLLHLDIKPSNVILCGPDLSPVLLDFGLSSKIDEPCEDILRLSHRGTPGFASYEQYHYSIGDRMRGRMDVYSLGATLYKMVTGYTPPTADEIVESPELLANSLAKNGVQSMVSDIILGSMSPVPSQGFQTVGEMLLLIDGAANEDVSESGNHINKVFGKNNQSDASVIYFSLPLDEPSGKRHLQEWIISREEMNMSIDHIQRNNGSYHISEDKWSGILDFISGLKLLRVVRDRNVCHPYRLEVNMSTGETYMIHFDDNESDRSLYIGLLGMFNSIYALNQGNVTNGGETERRSPYLRGVMMTLSVIMLICSSYSGLAPLHVPVLGEYVAVISGLVFALVWFLAYQYWEMHSRRTLCRCFFYMSSIFAILLSCCVFFLGRPVALPVWSLASCFTLTSALSLQTWGG